MLRLIAERTGEQETLTGFTLSHEQAAYLRENFRFDVKLDNFVTANYPREHYDKFISIGAWESVRPHENGSALKKIHDALKPGGRFVLHFFCRLAQPLPSASMVSQLFFPGHVPASFPELVQEFERAGFRIAHLSCHDYRHTLRQWFENLVARREDALRIVSVQTYNRYVVFFPASHKYFNDRTGMVFRFVLKKEE